MKNYEFPFEKGQTFVARSAAAGVVNPGDTITITGLQDAPKVVANFVVGSDPLEFGIGTCMLGPLEYVPRNGDVFLNKKGVIFMYTKQLDEVVWLTNGSTKPQLHVNTSKVEAQMKKENRLLFNINNITAKVLDAVQDIKYNWN